MRDLAERDPGTSRRLEVRVHTHDVGILQHDGASRCLLDVRSAVVAGQCGVLFVVCGIVRKR